MGRLLSFGGRRAGGEAGVAVDGGERLLRRVKLLEVVVFGLFGGGAEGGLGLLAMILCRRWGLAAKGDSSPPLRFLEAMMVEVVVWLDCAGFKNSLVSCFWSLVCVDES